MPNLMNEPCCRHRTCRARFNHRGDSIMSGPIKILLAALALVGVATVRTAHAEDLEFREVMHITSLQAQDVGDVDGHVMGLLRASGIASFQDGSTAAAYLIAQTDYVKGAGSISAICNLAFDDGSVLWYRTTGMATVDGARTLLKGTITVLGGKGRFAAAKGEGGFTGV